ncbi:FKBP-type peptidyl-prolyl cis-trans isomerase [Demequina sediminicola]|uniref:FKBP-type peptidyl-prolyl cis-trans isomerase n=1 Tax=Demequina sediminicola TaxID=1095026 RepID=UPI00078091D2|nr:hypothetical protein [Demequina sediminicola]
MRRIAIIATVSAVALAACTGPSPETEASPSLLGDIDQIVVGTSDSLAPSLEYETGLEYESAQTELLWDGEGEALVPGQSLLLDVYGESLDSADVVINTFDGSPAPYVLSPESVGQALYDVLINAHEGARVLTVEPAELVTGGGDNNLGEGLDTENGEPSEAPPLGLVVDVRADHAVGEDQEPVPGMPVVDIGEDGAPSITIAEDAQPVSELQTATLVKGAGPQITADSRVTMNYTMFYYADGEGTFDDGDGAAHESWSAGDIFDSTWEAERAPLLLDMSAGKATPGMVSGLLDHSEGSRVEMLIPGSAGYALRGTMVVVVDILDVWSPKA